MRIRPALAAQLTLVALALGGSAPAGAADCGGSVACQCGDRVVASITLPGHLDSCPGDGLTLVSGVLDCADHQISGPGDNTSTAGVILEGNGVTLQNCRLRNFGDGARVEGALGASILNNVAFDNAHGIWVGGGAFGTVIDGNEVRDNQDEGIHLGSGTAGSFVRNNDVGDNDAENVYLLGTTANVVEDNVLGGAKDAGIFVKNSWHNDVRRNTVGDRPILVRGDSYDNRFEDNDLLSGGYVFEAFEEDDVWTYPHDQTVTGGSVDASTCFEFLGSYDNTVTDTVVDDCRHLEEKEYGDLVPYGNVVSVIDVSPGSGSGGSGGSGSSGGSRKGRIKRSKPVGDLKDTLKLDFELPQGVDIDLATDDVEITVSDDDSIIYRVTFPAGWIEEKNSSRWQYKGKPDESPGGVKKLLFRFHPILGWSVKLRAKTNLDLADEADMTVEWTIGDDEGSTADQWQEKSNGWLLKP